MQIVKGTQLSIAYVRGQFPRSSDERNCISKQKPLSRKGK